MKSRPIDCDSSNNCLQSQLTSCAFKVILFVYLLIVMLISDLVWLSLSWTHILRCVQLISFRVFLSCHVTCRWFVLLRLTHIGIHYVEGNNVTVPESIRAEEEIPKHANYYLRGNATQFHDSLKSWPMLIAFRPLKIQISPIHKFIGTLLLNFHL